MWGDKPRGTDTLTASLVPGHPNAGSSSGETMGSWRARGPRGGTQRWCEPHCLPASHHAEQAWPGRQCHPHGRGAGGQRDGGQGGRGCWGQGSNGQGGRGQGAGEKGAVSWGTGGWGAGEAGDVERWGGGKAGGQGGRDAGTQGGLVCKEPSWAAEGSSHT